MLYSSQNQIVFKFWCLLDWSSVHCWNRAGRLILPEPWTQLCSCTLSFAPVCCTKCFAPVCCINCIAPNVLHQYFAPNILHQCVAPNVLHQYFAPNVSIGCTHICFTRAGCTFFTQKSRPAFFFHQQQQPISFLPRKEFDQPGLFGHRITCRRQPPPLKQSIKRWGNSTHRRTVSGKKIIPVPWGERGVVYNVHAISESWRDSWWF